MTKNVRICECCGQTIKTPKVIAPAVPIDTAAMTDAQLYAHYKKTAPLADLQFWIVNARMSDVLRQRFISLQAQPMATIKRELPRLQNAWREESNARELTERTIETIAA